MTASSKMDEVFQNCAKVSGLKSLKDFQRDCIENLIVETMYLCVVKRAAANFSNVICQ